MAVSASATATGVIRVFTIIAYLVTIFSLLYVTSRMQDDEEEKQHPAKKEEADLNSFEHIVGRASAKWSEIKSKLDTHDITLSKDDIEKELMNARKRQDMYSARNMAPKRMEYNKAPDRLVNVVKQPDKSTYTRSKKWKTKKPAQTIKPMEPDSAILRVENRSAAALPEPNISTNKTSARKSDNRPIKRLPDCLIIGARKAGTRAVLRFLRFHPRIKGIGPEIQYFSNPLLYAKGLEWYRDQMPEVTKGRIVVEKSAEYFHVWDAPERIYQMNKDLKMILVLREPYQRMISDYYFLQRYAKMINYTIKYDEVDHTLEELCINQTTGEVREEYGAVNRSKYIIHLQRYLQFFPLEQIHIVDGDKLAASNPASEMRKVEQFLGLKATSFPDDLFYFNETKGFFCTTREGCLDEEKGHKFPEYDPKFVQIMKNHFRPWNEMLYELIGYDFGW